MFIFIQGMEKVITRVAQGQKKSFVIMPDVNSSAFKEHVALRIKKAEKKSNRITSTSFWNELDEKRKEKYGF